jgi:hypothetical protein
VPARGPAALVALGVGVVALVIAWVRLPVPVHGIAWAEDASIYLQDSLSGLPLQHLFAPYEGYLQLAPRVLADFSALFGISSSAIVLGAASCLVAALVAVLVYFCSASVLPSHLRVIPALLTVLAPTIPIEILGTAANLHWLFLWLGPWLLLALPQSRVAAWVLASAALIATLSEIQLALFVPLLFLGPGWRRGRAVRIAFSIGLAAQLVATVLSPRDPESTSTVPPDVLSIGKNYISQVLLPIYVPRGEIINFFLVNDLLLWGILAFLPFVAALVIVLLHGTTLQRVVAATFFVSSGVLWTADVYVNHFGSGVPPPASFVFTRYGVLPGMFLIVVAVIAAQVLLQRSAATARVAARIGAIVIAGVVALALALAFVPSMTLRDGGPQWTASIATARRACIGAPLAEYQRVHVAPVLPGDGWGINLACGTLLR